MFNHCILVVLITGGNAHGYYVTDSEIWSPMGHTCNIPRMKMSRCFHAQFTVNNEITACGGWGAGQNDTCETLKDGKWSVTYGKNEV